MENEWKEVKDGESTLEEEDIANNHQHDMEFIHHHHTIIVLCVDTRRVGARLTWVDTCINILVPHNQPHTRHNRLSRLRYQNPSG